MKHSLKAVLVGLALCLGMAAAAPLHAQGRFTLSGTVYEKASGLPAPGAVVMVRAPAQVPPPTWTANIHSP